MAKHVKIAAYGGALPNIPQALPNDEIDSAVISHLSSILDTLLLKKPNMIVLPEMCDMSLTFTMTEYVDYILKRNNSVLDYICDTAKSNNVYIVYPTVRRTNDGYFLNSALIINRDGNVDGIYNKMYPTLGEIEVGIKAGHSPFVYECEYGRIGFAICFDLNFTSLAEQYREQNIDLLIFPGLFHGGILQSQWALITRSYFVGASGGCGASVVTPTGQVAAVSTDAYPWITFTINLDCKVIHLDFNKEKVQKAIEKYGDLVSVNDPGKLGRILLTWECSELSIADILREFQIEPLDDYLIRARETAVKNISLKGWD